ncbi:uncharacterized protein LOC119188349 [Manduca sexta]|uniref:uncharacterized protein LOC119188349 n=1 Tax=Manduca sexta TaxID=7130 RepID=UPI0011821786|nr:uncharacterized protein LOC115445256 isoform X2 [Manduca sexta]XP_037294479.1 uncharacterized protein LOC119188349 [Manduca sexta]
MISFHGRPSTSAVAIHSSAFKNFIKMDFKFLFVLCVACLLLTSVLSKPIADGSAEAIGDESASSPSSPLLRVKRHIAGDPKCPKGQEKINGICTEKSDDY